MVDSTKNPHPNPIPTDLKALISAARPRRTKAFAYGFVFAFVACTAFLAFNPSTSASSPWSSSSSSFKDSVAPYRDHVSSLFSHFFPNSSSPSSAPPLPGDHGNGGGGSPKDAILGNGSALVGALRPNKTQPQPPAGSEEKGQDPGKIGKNQTDGGVRAPDTVQSGALEVNKQNVSAVSEAKQGKNGDLQSKNQTKSGSGLQGSEVSNKNQTANKGNGVPASAQEESKANSTQKSGHKGIEQGTRVATNSPAKAKSSSSNGRNNNGTMKKREKWIEDMIGCDIFHGHWVKDESYPLYSEGSCPHIDEPFDCYLNGRPDRSYQKLRWQPTGCNIPRLNPTDMLERLRGKRLVFVGDSLNRNMWESLVCVLRNSVKDKKKVLEASGRHEFRTEGSYSFLFKDYGATVEFFRSPFLVQEWEMPAGNGTKETLRLDIIERSSSKYKDAHVIIFNTGHWWTHEKTAKGKDYYQEGNRVYSDLNVVEAFHKALNTWAKWVDANVNPKRTFVFFRGYSASHFSGGQWNSGGACDKETEPIKNEKYLSSYPPKMSVLESVIRGMKTPVSYLNITRMTDYRKDAHPSVYRKQNLTEEERKDPLRFQDCSHWCLPGVPDSWNELIYALLIIKQYQRTQ